MWEETVCSLPLENPTVNSNKLFFFFFSLLVCLIPLCFFLNCVAREEFDDLCFRFGIELDDVVSASVPLSLSVWFRG